MSRLPDTTADLVVAAVDAVVSANGDARVGYVADFMDVPQPTAQAALDLAVDLGLLAASSTRYTPRPPLARLLVTSSDAQRAAVLRVAVESFEPFVLFRERLRVTGVAAQAAQQARTALGLTEHKSQIAQTLTSLGTYTRAIRDEGAGLFTVPNSDLTDLAQSLDAAVDDLTTAEVRVRDWFNEKSAGYVSQADVLQPLADAYRKAAKGDSRGAIVSAGNAIESFLVQLAGDLSVNLQGATGIGSKVDRFSQASKFPSKLAAVGKYLSNVRNAADHGIDTDTGAAWDVRPGTGIDYLRVVITFIDIGVGIVSGEPWAI